jgi:NodT family efflux transporter outer membrane factor (OMF) lipoprotein
VSYALDIWGGARRGLESASAQAQYQRDELEAAYLTLTANIVTAAIQEASLQAQIVATDQVIAAEEQQLSILQNQVSLGGVAQASVLQEQATLAASQATLPPLQAAMAQARNQLAAYAGVLPGDFHEADFTLASLHLPEALPVSVPSAIVAQRPDIQAAAAQLHEASANVGVADAQMLPQISLTADVGHEAISTGELFMPQTLLWSLVAGVTQPIFEGGELSAKRKAALAALQVSGAQYQATVIAAFQNVADALSALQYDAMTLNAADAAADAAAQSLSVTQAQYQLGGQPLTAVLVAQTSYQDAAIAQVKASAARLADTAALYQALGGGWWQRNDVSTPCCGVIP